MNNYLVLSKLITLIYCVLMYIIKHDSSNSKLTVMTLLMLICISVTSNIVKKEKLRSILLVITGIYIIILYCYVSKYFIFFLPLIIYEISFKYTISLIINICIIVVQVCCIDKTIISEYIFIALMNYLICNVIYKTEKKINKLIDENDILRNKNSKLIKDKDKNLELQNQVKYFSQLEERNKIAQEIHDKIGHTISGSLMQLEASKLLIDKDKNKALVMLENTINVLREGMENIRVTLRSIKPPSEQLGVNKIKLLLDEFRVNSAMKVTFNYNGNLENINYTYWKVIYENIYEALTNSLKYSKASSINVKIDVLNKYIKVEVKDNGTGADKIVKGIGLTGIEERTANIGGKVIIDGSAGFSVIILLPTML